MKHQTTCSKSQHGRSAKPSQLAAYSEEEMGSPSATDLWGQGGGQPKKKKKKKTCSQ